MDEKRLYAMRHSMAHLTAAAIQKLWPGAKFGVGPVVEDGFYYDIDLAGDTISNADFPKIEKEIKKLIKQNDEFLHFELPIDEAIKWARDNKQDYKEELLNDLKRAGTTVAKELDIDQLGVSATGEAAIETVSFYRNGDFTDLCRGPHVESTGEVSAFKLIRVAGAYWRGKNDNPQMQRVYGIAFATQEQLDEHLLKLELARQNDHKKLGREMELFFFDTTAPGMAYWMPKGLAMKNLLIQYWRQYHSERGYQEISSPLLNKQELFETSGHWAHYKNDMFLSEREPGEWWALKPMNCPNAMKFWLFKQRSYKDLPLRFADTDVLHRDEITGALNGLLRSRIFTQDDSHNFVRENQIANEVTSIIAIVRDFYKAFGIDDNVKLYLSTRPEEGYLGELAVWDKAESELRTILQSSGFEFGIKEGDGAFYGPKIDIHLNDALGREWQCGTIQLDFQLPRQFGLVYTDEHGGDVMPVVIHRVIYGSLERFIGIITEHFGGRYPLWFAPEQVRILALNDSVQDYVDEISAILGSIEINTPVKHNRLRHFVDKRNESLGKKIREATLSKVPIQLVVGNKEKERREVGVRTQKGEETVALSELSAFITQLAQ